MKIEIIGGGPSGLYLAILLKKHDPDLQIRITEREVFDATFGWGVVFSGQTMSFIADTDAPTRERMAAHLQTWDNVDIIHRGEKVSVLGNRFSGFSRLELLLLLQDRARELDVELVFETEVNDLTTYADADLIVGADGVNSTVRRLHADALGAKLEWATNRFVWCGTRQLFHGLTLIFRETDAGLFIAHCYKYCADLSTFIVECDPQTYERAGFTEAGEEHTCAYLAEVFADDLGGEPLLTNKSWWRTFPVVSNARWSTGNVALLGDALHTAHFSIGSGTKLAMESSIALAESFKAGGDVPEILARWEAARRPPVERLQAAAYDSMRWFETAGELMHLDPVAFAYQTMVRSGDAITHEKLRQRDPAFVARYEAATG